MDLTTDVVLVVLVVPVLVGIDLVQTSQIEGQEVIPLRIHKIKLLVTMTRL